MVINKFNPELLRILQPFMGRWQEPGRRAHYTVSGEGVERLARMKRISWHEAARICQEHGIHPQGEE